MPHISNFIDLDALKSEEDVSIRFITSKGEFKEPDLLIIPGSKNTIEDLLYLRQCGLEESIKEYSKEGKIMGICGGYQLLGKTIKDPYNVETDLGEVDGLNLLDMETTFEEEKVTTRVWAEILNEKNESNESKVYGYEIHMGISKYGSNVKLLFKIYDKNGDHFDGAINEKGNVMGTYIHGVFDGVCFREKIINELRIKKGLKEKKAEIYEKLRESLDMEKIYSIIGAK